MLCKRAESRSQAPAPVWDVTSKRLRFPLAGLPRPQALLSPSRCWLGAPAEREHHSSPQQRILRAAKCLFCQHVPNPQPKADEKSHGGGRMGISCPLKQSPDGDSHSPEAGNGISGAHGAGAAREMRGMGIPPPAPRSLRAPCSPSTLQQGWEGGMALQLQPCHKSQRLLKPQQDLAHLVGGARNTSSLQSNCPASAASQGFSLPLTKAKPTSADHALQCPRGKPALGKPGTSSSHVPAEPALSCDTGSPSRTGSPEDWHFQMSINPFSWWYEMNLCPGKAGFQVGWGCRLSKQCFPSLPTPGRLLQPSPATDPQIQPPQRPTPGTQQQQPCTLHPQKKKKKKYI